MDVLTVNNLTKTFTTGLWPLRKQQQYTAVNNVSFNLKKGEILGLLGPNGAGKTTTIQMLLGTLAPTSGTITYSGIDFTHDRIAALKRIGYASGYDRLPARLTVVENLDIVGRIYGMSHVFRMQQITMLLDFFKISHLKDRHTGTLSAGQATRVMLAKAFIANPDIVLLDEPTASLDPDVAHDVRRFIVAQRAERGISLLITSHNMDEVTELCDRVLVLKKGALVANDAPTLLAQSIAKVRMHLAITANLDAAIAYLNQQQLVYTVDKQQLTIELDEHAIAPLIVDLGVRGVLYNQISIDKPTLEDYFLAVAQEKDKA